MPAPRRGTAVQHARLPRRLRGFCEPAVRVATHCDERTYCGEMRLRGSRATIPSSRATHESEMRTLTVIKMDQLYTRSRTLRKRYV